MAERTILDLEATGTLNVAAVTNKTTVLSDLGVATVGTDAIWDVAGDLVVGTGANTAARLAKGAALDVLRVNAGATALEWAAPASTGAPTAATYITQTPHADLSAEQALSLLATGLMVVTTTTGAITSVAIPLPVASGGTGTVTGSITGTAGLTFTATGSGNNITLQSGGGSGFVQIVGGFSASGYFELAEQTAPAAPVNAGRMYFDTSNRFSWIGENGFVRTLDGTANSADRIYVLPNAAGTIALTNSALNPTSIGATTPGTGAFTTVRVGNPPDATANGALDFHTVDAMGVDGDVTWSTTLGDSYGSHVVVNNSGELTGEARIVGDIISAGFTGVIGDNIAKAVAQKAGVIIDGGGGLTSGSGAVVTLSAFTVDNIVADGASLLGNWTIIGLDIPAFVNTLSGATSTVYSIRAVDKALFQGALQVDGAATFTTLSASGVLSNAGAVSLATAMTIGTGAGTTGGIYRGSRLWLTDDIANGATSSFLSVGAGVKSSIGIGIEADLFLQREAAATLQVGIDAATGVNQKIKAMDASAGTGGNLTLAAGTGTTAGGALILQTAATGTLTDRLTITAAGAATFTGSVSGLQFDAGNSGYFGFGANRTIISSTGDGLLTVWNRNADNFNRETYGGTTSSFPALKRVGAELQVTHAATTAAINVAAVDAELSFIEDRYRRKGSGSPEGAITAPIGAIYHRTDGGDDTAVYSKISGSGNTGWKALENVP